VKRASKINGGDVCFKRDRTLRECSEKNKIHYKGGQEENVRQDGCTYLMINGCHWSG